MKVRVERPEDRNAVRQINLAAFGRENEANLVDLLRHVASIISLVAIDLDRVVGHILFSPVTIEGECQGEGLFWGLAPVAVLAEERGKGIGSLLIRRGLEECDRMGIEAIFVLGSPEYYRRFGFRAAKERGLKCEYDGSDEAFMVLELVGGALKNSIGVVKYRPEFSIVE
jgi:putative acetyltransferase